MPTRKYVTDPARLLAEGQMLLNASDDSKFQHKVEMVNLVLSGLTPSYLSQYCGDSKNAITLWVKIADEQGFDALHTKKHPGRPRKLTSEQLTELQQILEADNPKEYGYNVWDGPSLSAFIAERYSVSIGQRQCQRMFHLFGFSLVRPQTFPSKDEQNEEARTAYKKTL